MHNLSKKATIATRRGSKFEINKYVRPVSTIVGVSTSEDGEISSYFDNNNENHINNTTFKEILVDNHTIQANKIKAFGQLALEHLFWIL